MGIRDWFRKLRGKEETPKTYDLQVHQEGAERGWKTINRSDVPIQRTDALDFFVPGSYYRVLVRDIESGKYTGTLWKHYEPRIGLEPVAQPMIPRPAMMETPPTPTELMSEYAAGLKEALDPLLVLTGVVSDIQEAFAGFGSKGGQGQGGGQGSQDIPPLEFSGQAPWVMHPYIVKEFAGAINSVVDHAADRFIKPFQKSGLLEETEKKPVKKEAEEEVDFELLGPEVFKEKKGDELDE